MKRHRNPQRTSFQNASRPTSREAHRPIRSREQRRKEMCISNRVLL